MKDASIGRRTVRGAVWKVGASLGSRVVGVLGTLVLTWFLAPSVMGEVAIASAVVLTATTLTAVGFGTYVVSHPEASSEAVFHATFYNLVLALVAFAAVLALRHPLAAAVGAPGMAEYVPGLAFAALLSRIGLMPSQILTRDLRFGILAIGVATGELAFTVASIALAATGWGGHAIVLGGVARSGLRAALHLACVRRRDWLLPCRLSLRRTRELFGFGAPLTLGVIAANAARQWDRLIFSRRLGVASAGLYNLSFNLADIATSQVGEQVGDVLLPSYARLAPAKRREVLQRGIALMSLVVAPIAVGLAVVAPTLVAVAFSPEWRGIAPMLTVLSSLSIVRPIGWCTHSYLVARKKPVTVMALQVARLVVILAALWILAGFGVIWACLGVGLGHAAHTLASLWLCARLEGLRLVTLCRGAFGPLLATAPMVAAVLGVRAFAAQSGLGPGVVALLLEVLTGACVYALAVLVLARPQIGELLRLLAAAYGDRSTPTPE